MGKDKISLEVGDNIEFNSEPEDDENEDSHIHFGEVVSISKNQINIQLDDGETNTYFIDEIDIIDTINNQNENNNNYYNHYIDHQVNNYPNHFENDYDFMHENNADHNDDNIPNYAPDPFNIINIKQKQNVQQEKLLTLEGVLRINSVEQPYWWKSLNNFDGSHNTVVKCDPNQHIFNEIIAKFYEGLHNIDEIGNIEISSIQNVNLWRQYQNKRQIRYNSFLFFCVMSYS